MPRTGAKFDLSSYDDIFSSQAERDSKKAEQETDTGERVKLVELAKLVPFKNHPFKVKDDEDMEKTVDSIRQFGVLNPVIVRPNEDGTFEIVSGHRRCHASELAGLDAVPAIVRELDDDAATILMVDSNLQRETLLPSERAWAFKMKLDALKHQGVKRENDSSFASVQLGRKLEATDLIAEESAESRSQVKRFMLTRNLLRRCVPASWEWSFLRKQHLNISTIIRLTFSPGLRQSVISPIH